MSPNEHAWARRAISLRGAGLLDESAERRLEEHLADCADCRAAATRFEGEPDEPRVSDGHIPADVLGRWATARGTLRGIERALVRSHLESCPACREELEFLGHAPQLEVVPGLELTEPDSGSLPEPMPSSSRRPRRVPGAPRRHVSWGSFAFGGALGAAAAMLLLFTSPALLTLRAPRGGPGTTDTTHVSPPTTNPPTPGVPPSDEPELMLAGLPLEGRSLRGADSTTRPPEITRVPRQWGALPMRLPLLPDWPSQTLVDVVLSGPDGHEIARSSHRLSDLFGRTVVVLRRGRLELRSGTYTLRIERAAGPSADAPEASFRIHVADR